MLAGALLLLLTGAVAEESFEYSGRALSGITDLVAAQYALEAALTAMEEKVILLAANVSRVHDSRCTVDYLEWGTFSHRRAPAGRPLAVRPSGLSLGLRHRAGRHQVLDHPQLLRPLLCARTQHAPPWPARAPHRPSPCILSDFS